ncbi:DUF5129 domain-containing protein [Brachybacterium sp. MASK1Z-5]|uniref:DUF5129 domain-containing protein n=1 Tax=Brachybacterium halotolerans TaxID=2795215 RepID=A0ABS1B8Z2_9MICO|nr:DUF5129 domain-containing protein [Brachybacterium halotolerans]MBK0330657.1 DUF5129 domain-containing protein [Brachybacterium halotolerans]
MDPHPQAPTAPPAPPTPRATTRALAPSTHVRSLVLVLVGALALLALLAPLLAPGALAAPPGSVEIDDAQGIIDDPDALEGRLQDIDLREAAAPVDLKVVTLDISGHDADPSADTGLNDAVLHFARSEHPDWIDGEKWADGVVILAIDPDNRKVGTYAGEDVKLSDGDFEDVQDAMKDDASDGAWADAFDAGAQKYADLLGRPWWRSPGAIIGAFIALVALGAGAVAALARGAGSRRRVRTARERFDNVRAKRQETDQAASRIPRDSSYGATILADVEDYRRAVDEAETTSSALPARPGPLWGIGPASARRAKEFATSVEVADRADDTIIGAARLLGRSGDFRSAWEEERRPLDESLAAVEQTIAEVLDPADADTEFDSDSDTPGEQGATTDSDAAAGLRSTARQVSSDLEEVSTAYLDGGISPDDALERLDELTERLSAASERLRDEAIGVRTQDEDEAKVMRDAEPEHFTSDFPTSVRGRQFARHPQDYVSGYSLSPVLWTGAWYGGATTALDTHRNPPASSGSTSGYSGGGFSGAGSSSSF